MSKQEQIIQGALSLFMRMGVKGINMDYVATHLGISKKTLYQHVDNKADLVEQSFASHQCKVKSMIESICAKHENAIDELFEIDSGICRMLKDRNPYLIQNLKTCYPKVWTLLDDLKKKYLFKTVKNNLDTGIKKGLYRKEINTDIITKLMMTRIDALVDNDIFPLTEYDFKELLKENRIYHIRGIASEKGINYLEKKLKK